MSGEGAAETWERRYGERERLWSGNPNPSLVALVERLPLGRALDLGCGEGADCVWLAEQGWEVTGVDISATAVERGRTLAAQHSVRSANIQWVVADLATWRPSGCYDLVSACYLHAREGLPRHAIVRRAASAVTPGGHLLVVGHASVPPWARAHEGHDPHDLLVAPEEEVAGIALDPSRWSVLVADVRPRESVTPDGERVTIDDSVVFARRR